MSYATDGKCHNAEPGTFGHECGKPATWIGRAPTTHTRDGFHRVGFCDDCKANGYEAKQFGGWERIPPAPSKALGSPTGDDDPEPGKVGED